MINPIHIPTVSGDGIETYTWEHSGCTTIQVRDNVLYRTMMYTIDHSDYTSSAQSARMMDWFFREYEERRTRIVQAYRDIFAPGSAWEQYHQRPMWPLLGDRIGPRICTLVQSISGIRVHIMDYPNTYTASATWVLDHLHDDGDGCYEEYALWAESVGETAYTREDY